MPEDNDTQEKLVEERAKLQGWVPMEEFRGESEKWKPAGEFLKIGEDRWPIQNERIRTLETRLGSTLEKLDRQDRSIKDFVEFQKGRDQRAVETAKKELKEEQLAAVKDADPEKFLQLEKQIGDLEKETEKKPEDKLEPPPGYDEWCAENEWYEADLELTAYADQIAGLIQRQTPGLKGKAFFDKVGVEVKKKYPEKFENPNRIKSSAVEGAGGGDGGGKVEKKAYSNLPAEAKAACDQFVQDIPGFTKEQYCKDYDWAE